MLQILIIIAVLAAGCSQHELKGLLEKQQQGLAASSYADTSQWRTLSELRDRVIDEDDPQCDSTGNQSLHALFESRELHTIPAIAVKLHPKHRSIALQNVGVTNEILCYLLHIAAEHYDLTVLLHVCRNLIARNVVFQCLSLQNADCLNVRNGFASIA